MQPVIPRTMSMSMTWCLLALTWCGSRVVLARRRKPSLCDSEPCQNGGWCIDLTSPSGEKKFQCSCREGYKGLTCQKKINPCNEEPCLNEGKCLPKGENFHCVCQQGFQGKRCDKKKDIHPLCRDKPCGPHGVCQAVNDDFICECLPGYSGPRCENEDKKSVGVVVADDSSLRGMVFAVLISLILVVTVLTLVAIHCFRVYNRRSDLRAAQERRKTLGLEPNPLPGWLETSNEMCRTCLCCGNIPVLDHVTGVIVPVGEYHSMLDGHKGGPPPAARMSQVQAQPQPQTQPQLQPQLQQSTMALPLAPQPQSTMALPLAPQPQSTMALPLAPQPSGADVLDQQTDFVPMMETRPASVTSDMYTQPAAPLRKNSIHYGSTRLPSVRPVPMSAPSRHNSSIRWASTPYMAPEPARTSQYRNSTAQLNQSHRPSRPDSRASRRPSHHQWRAIPHDHFDFTDHHGMEVLDDPDAETSSHNFGRLLLSRGDIMRRRHQRAKRPRQPRRPVILKNRSRSPGSRNWMQRYLLDDDEDDDDEDEEEEEERALLGMKEYDDDEEEEEEEEDSRFSRGEIREFYQSIRDDDDDDHVIVNDDDDDDDDSEVDSGQSDHDFQGPSDDGYGSTTRFSDPKPLGRLRSHAPPRHQVVFERPRKRFRLWDLYRRHRRNLYPPSSFRYSPVDTSEDEDGSHPYASTFSRRLKPLWKGPSHWRHKDFSRNSGAQGLDSDGRINRGSLMEASGMKKAERRSKKSPPKVEVRRKGILKKTSKFSNNYGGGQGQRNQSRETRFL